MRSFTPAVARLAAATPVAAGADGLLARQPAGPAHLPCEGHGADIDVLDADPGVAGQGPGADHAAEGDGAAAGGAGRAASAR